MASEHRLQSEGAVDEVSGKVRQVAGIVTGNETEEAKGKAQSTGGKLKRKAGEALADVKKMVNDI